jgi:hypothetical protein
MIKHTWIPIDVIGPKVGDGNQIMIDERSNDCLNLLLRMEVPMHAMRKRRLESPTGIG